MTCYECGGRGSFLMDVNPEEHEDCERCEGTGEIEEPTT